MTRTKELYPDLETIQERVNCSQETTAAINEFCAGVDKGCDERAGRIFLAKMLGIVQHLRDNPVEIEVDEHEVNPGAA